MISIVITNLLVGFAICTILILNRIESRKINDLFIAKLEENIRTQKDSIKEIKQALIETLKSIDERNDTYRSEVEVIRLEAIRLYNLMNLKIKSQDKIVKSMHAFINVRYAIFLENDKKNKVRIAELTHNQEDIDAAKLAEQAYETHTRTEKIVIRSVESDDRIE